MNIKFLRAFDEDFFAVGYPGDTKDVEKTVELIYKIAACYSENNHDGGDGRYFENDKIIAEVSCKNPATIHCAPGDSGWADFVLSVGEICVFDAYYNKYESGNREIIVLINKVTPKIIRNLEQLLDSLKDQADCTYFSSFDALPDSNVPDSFI